MADQHSTRLDAVVNGYQDTAIVLAAVRLDLPDLMAGGLTDAESLAAAAGCRVPELTRLLRGLQMIGMVLDEDGHHRLTDEGRMLLRDAPEPHRQLVELVADQYWGAWTNLAHAARTGEPGFTHLHGTGPFEWRAQHAEAGRLFSAWLHKETAGLTESIAETIDLTGVRTLADVGGGDGALLRSLLARHPSIRGSLLDRDEVVRRAAADWPAELDARTSFVPVDFFEEIAVDADAYVLKSVLHDWDDEEVGRILLNCADALPSDGSLFVVERVLDQGTESTIRLDLHMMAVTGGQERSMDALAGLVVGAGLAVAHVAETTTGFTVIEARHP